MLVLTRRLGQSLMIGEDIEVAVLAVDRQTGKVRVGIRRPDDVHIVRTEILEPEMARA